MIKSRKSTKPNLSRIDIHKLLNERRQIAVIWCVDDVQAMRPDLNDDQAWEVLLECRRFHDLEIRFTWLCVADSLFPSADE